MTHFIFILSKLLNSSITINLMYSSLYLGEYILSIITPIVIKKHCIFLLIMHPSGAYKFLNVVDSIKIASLTPHTSPSGGACPRENLQNGQNEPKQDI